ncbi:MAG: hypothetical protein KQH63_20650 [Desulfobulbaceae bacterium]|nr:hypothetical protein [Desulfobulbaceae bacterium]
MKKTSPLSLLLLVGIIAFFSIQSCVSVPIEQRIDYKPMYGQPEIPRPEYMKKADDDFIREAISGFGGSREDASKAWASVADEFLSNGDLYNAMRRYNQSWLLDPNNYHPYHGFGQIMLARGEVDEAVKYMEKAKELVSDPYQRPAVLNDTGIAYSYKAQSVPVSNQTDRAKYFAMANQNFEESTQDKTYKEVWRRWAYSLFEEGKYSETWEKVKMARSIGAAPMPPKFISALSEKMPEPK